MKPKKNFYSYIYLFYSKDLELYKIGVSKDSHRRKKQIQTGFPFRLTLVVEYKSEYAYKIESALHNKYKIYKTAAHSIELEGEWFNIPKDVIGEFENVCKMFENSTKILKEMGNPFV